MDFRTTTGARRAVAHVVGVATTRFAPELDAMQDELVFDVVYRALAEAGLRRSDIGLSVTASMDAYDGRSISAGLTSMASGGLLTDSYRVEGDGGVAVLRALEGVGSGDVEVAVAVAVHNPEHKPSRGPARDFLEQLSNLAFEPHTDRGIGMTAETTLGLQAAHYLSSGSQTLHDLATVAAQDISRGSSHHRSVRPAVTADDVMSSPAVTGSLRDLMLPAYSAGAAAVVLASPARAARCTGRSFAITGWGHATGPHSSSDEWLTDPSAPTRRAAAAAFERDSPARPFDIIEASIPSPALRATTLEALSTPSAPALDPTARGGLLSCYPGLANGTLRLIEAVEQAELAGPGTRALSHSIDMITGLACQDVTVLTGEAL